ncbi:nucleotidyltransferase domain-containing protein [bacterium]|nr:nucleotidyltransferase domain-containing protein [bacterium]
MEREIEVAKKVIVEEIEKRGLKVKKIFLFGSRAKGQFKKESDWDFYVIIDREIDFISKTKILTQIKRRLAKYKIPNDIIIQSAPVVAERKNDVGYLTYYVLKEGIEI